MTPMVAPPIMDPNPVGADETAYFVTHGPDGTTDQTADYIALVFTADSSHGALPPWVSIIDGSVHLNENAGTCVFAFAGVADLDFTDTTPPAEVGSLAFGGVPVINGQQAAGRTAPPSAGNGQNLQTTAAVTLGSIISGSTLGVAVSAAAYADGGEQDNIADGVSTPRGALTVTRIGQAAVIPES